MKIGIPKESMTGEFRVALTPEDCAWLAEQGCKIHIEHDAGSDSGYSDKQYTESGCVVAYGKPALYANSELIVKVKQPLIDDLEYLQEKHTVFSYMHLAADPELIRTLCEIGLTAIPFESIQDDEGNLPLLAPMSAIAGRVAVLRGASLLFRNRGGSGVLLGGPQLDSDHADRNGRVVVIGAGVAGSRAAITAASLGAQVTVLDLNEDRLQRLHEQTPAINVMASTADNIDFSCYEADLVIGAVLIAGRRAPVVLKESTLKKMRPGSVIMDIAIDQGGCIEGIRKTDANDPYYEQDGLLMSAVPNMPATVARTSSQALSAVIREHVARLARDEADEGLQKATAIQQGRIIDPVLSEEFESESA